MPKIYERNPDTDEIRERDFNDYQTAADSMRDMNRDDHLNRDKEPNPYRNEMAEAVEILQRMNEKLDRLLEQQQEHLESCLLYTSPSPRDKRQSRMPSSA